MARLDLTDPGCPVASAVTLLLAASVTWSSCCCAGRFGVQGRTLETTDGLTGPDAKLPIQAARGGAARTTALSCVASVETFRTSLAPPVEIALPRYEEYEIGRAPRKP